MGVAFVYRLNADEWGPVCRVCHAGAFTQAALWPFSALNTLEWERCESCHTPQWALT